MIVMPRRKLRNHPAGLLVLIGAELWDRISFHGMQALLVLYMIEALLPGPVDNVIGFSGYRSAVEALTGPMSVQALAAQTFGLYVGLVYFTPIIGGWIGDQLTSRRAGVVSGGLLMTAGHFAMAFEATFLVALLLLIVGAGLFRGNLVVQVSALYAEGDPRAADAFQLFYVGINVGAFVAPLITGTLAATYGWHIGFGFAGVGMMVALVTYLLGQKHLPPDRVRVATAPRDALTVSDRRRLAGLAILVPVQVLFWIAASQIWNVYNLWARDHLERNVGGFEVPVPWLQAIDGLAAVVLVPPLLAFWRWQARRNAEPDDLSKLVIGCLLFAFATATLAGGSLVIDDAGRTPFPWVLGFHLISNVGWIYFLPTTTAIYAIKSPAALRGMLLGVNTFCLFIASVISGRLGGLYETMAPAQFWLLHAALVGAGGVMLIVFARTLNRLLQDDELCGNAPGLRPIVS